MAFDRYVALLRGINVGGRNSMPMAELRMAFVAEGYRDVRTYIQSGNVLFTAAGDRRSLERSLEEMLRRRRGADVPVVVRSRRQMGTVVRGAPPGFGADREKFLYDVAFLKAPLTAEQALEAFETREGVDRAWSGTGVVYFSRLSARRAQSRFSRMTSAPEYARMTIRNWNTTTKLAELLSES